MPGMIARIALLLLILSAVSLPATAQQTPVCVIINGSCASATNPVPTTGTATLSGSTSNASSGVATSSTNVPVVGYNYTFNGTTWDQWSSLTVGSKHAGTVAIVDASGNQITSFGTALPVATAGIAPYISTSLESCHVMKASQATAISYGVTTGATAGYLMVFNATSAPADGAVTPAALAIQIPANATVTRTYSPPSTLQLSTGFTVCFSSTGPFTKTASATAMLEGTWQ